jgi:hypothetical protein
MSRRQTLFEQMARNPRGDWTINDIEILCRQNGLSCIAPRGGGSHYKVSGGGVMLTIPARRKIKPVYIKALIGLIRKMRDERT